MPRFARSELMERFRAMAERREPIIGGGAGTGLSARCEQAGGIDLIVIYNSGRYRMAGRGSLAGILAYGNANEIVVEMGREVLPVATRTPVLAAEAGGFAPMKEMAGAINEKTAAFMEGLAAAQFAWLHSAVMLPVAYAKARSPFTPLLDMAETVTSAALAPAGRRVRRNHRRLSKS